MIDDRPSLLTPETLAAVGEALFGDDWRALMADALGISARSLRYMLDGTRPVHEGFVSDLERIAEQRHADVRALLAQRP